MGMEQRTGSKFGEGVRQACILSPCLFQVCTEYIMRNARLGEAQAGINTAGKNIKEFLSLEKNCKRFLMI